MIFKSTKSYYNLPCSHQQWKDKNEDGSPGQCTRTHGYSREFHFEFTATDVDSYGWVVGFGSLKPLKKWLNYMFDHTSLFEASDPRLHQVIQFNKELNVSINELRVLPSGVSMEQTALFVALHWQDYILSKTDNRCFISKITIRENDKNSGILEMTKEDAHNFANFYKESDWDKYKKIYEYIPPVVLINCINNNELPEINEKMK